MRVLVAGATGNVGSALVQSLTDLFEDGAVEIRALTRSASHPKSPALASFRDAKHVEVVECANFGDVASLRSAFENVDAAFLSSANFKGQVEHEQRFIDAAIASESCRYLVKLGTVRLVTKSDSHVEYGRFHADIEQYLAEKTEMSSSASASSLQWTVLCPAWFMSNHLGDVFGTLPQNIIAYPAQTQSAFTPIDPRDIGIVAAQLLMSTTDQRSTYHTLTLDIGGPQETTMAEIAACYTRVLGRTIQHVQCTPDEWVAGAVQAGFEDWLAQAAVTNFKSMDDGDMVIPSSPQVLALAQPPTRTMAQWIEEWGPRSPSPPASA